MCLPVSPTPVCSPVAHRLVMAYCSRADRKERRCRRTVLKLLRIRLCTVKYAR